jgi:flagellar biosynthesis/type III secretory pathway protein FliH
VAGPGKPVTHAVPLVATPLAERLPTVDFPGARPWFEAPAVSAPRPLFSPPAATPTATVDDGAGAAAVAAAQAELAAERKGIEKAREDAEKAGLATAQAKVEEIVERYLDGIQRLLQATRLAHRPEPGEVVELALLVAKEVLGRELSMDRSILMSAIDRALSSVSADTQLVLRVSPADAAYVKHRRPELLREGVVLVEDKKIAVGGCIVETPAWVLDASIEARLEAVRGGLVELMTSAAADVAEVDETPIAASQEEAASDAADDDASGDASDDEVKA